MKKQDVKDLIASLIMLGVLAIVLVAYFLVLVWAINIGTKWVGVSVDGNAIAIVAGIIAVGVMISSAIKKTKR